MKDMQKSIKMLCSVCGNDQFSTIDESIENLLDAPDETEIKCSDCGLIVSVKDIVT
jgi:uncharacterized Zn finger protein